MTPSRAKRSSTRINLSENKLLQSTELRTRKQLVKVNKENIDVNQFENSVQASLSDEEQLDLPRDVCQAIDVADLEKYKLVKTLRMHFRSDANDDIEAEQPTVWHCAFAPRLPEEIKLDQPVYVIASCGSNSVCVTDCSLRQVQMKYPHVDEPNEVFQALAWTVIPYGSSHARILSVGGRCRSVKLINTAQKICYRYLEGHKGAINALEFSKLRPFWLFSGSEDKTVRLWDIGTEDCYSHCLAVFEARYPVLDLALSPDEEHFFASNNDCAIAEFDMHQFTNGSLGQNKKAYVKVSPLTYYDGDGWYQSPVDYMQFIDEDHLILKACKNVLDVIKVSECTEESPFVLASEKWTDGLLAVKGSLHQNLLFIGNAVGSIFVYQLNDTYDQMSVVQQMDDLSSKSAIRKVDVSLDGKFVVAVDDKDAMWVWERQ